MALAAHDGKPRRNARDRPWPTSRQTPMLRKDKSEKDNKKREGFIKLLTISFDVTRLDTSPNEIYAMADIHFPGTLILNPQLFYCNGEVHRYSIAVEKHNEAVSKS